MTNRDRIEVYVTCIGYDTTPAEKVTKDHVKKILDMADLYIQDIEKRLEKANADKK